MAIRGNLGIYLLPVALIAASFGASAALITVGTGTTTEGVDYVMAYDPSKVIDLYKMQQQDKNSPICGRNGTYLPCPKGTFMVSIGFYNSAGVEFRVALTTIYCGNYLVPVLKYVFIEQDVDPATGDALSEEEGPTVPTKGSVPAVIMAAVCRNKSK